MANYQHVSLVRAGYLNEVILENEYMSVGISSNGTHGTNVPAPAGFHPITSVRQTVGLSINQEGFSSGQPPTVGDFFLPGMPEERFTVGINGTSSFYNTRDGAQAITPISIRDDSTASQLKCTWTGAVAGVFDLTLSYSINPLDKYFSCTATITNRSNAVQSRVRFVRSFDPDQDHDLRGSFNTTNTIELQGPTDGQSYIRANGVVTGAPFSFYSDDPRSYVGTDFGGIAPATAYVANVTGLPKGYSSTGDAGICIAFEEPSLAPGQSVTFTYYSSLAATAQETINEIRSGFTLSVPSGSTVTPSVDVDRSVVIPVSVATLSGVRDGPITVKYRTINDTALAGTDYTSTTGTITFPVGTDLVNIPITVLKTSQTGGSKAFNLELYDVTGGRLLNSLCKVTLAYNAIPAPDVVVRSPQNSLFADSYKLELSITPRSPVLHSGTVTKSGVTVATWSTEDGLTAIVPCSSVQLAKGVNTFYLNFTTPSFAPVAVLATRLNITNSNNFRLSKIATSLMVGELGGRIVSAARLLRLARQYDATLVKRSTSGAFQHLFNKFRDI